MEDNLVWQDLDGFGNGFYDVLAYELTIKNVCSTTCTAKELRNEVANRIKLNWHYYNSLVWRRKSILHRDSMAERNLCCLGVRLGNVFIDNLECRAVADQFNVNLIIKNKTSGSKTEILARHLQPVGKAITIQIGYDPTKQRYLVLMNHEDAIRFQSLYSEQACCTDLFVGLFNNLFFGKRLNKFSLVGDNEQTVNHKKRACSMLLKC